MNFKKILGILLGIIIGSLPFINAAACCILAFSRRKFRIGILIAVALVSQIVAMTISMKDADKVKADALIFSQNFNRQILALKFSGNKPVNTFQLEDSLTVTFVNTAKQFVIPRPNLVSIFNNAVEGTLTTSEKENFHNYVLKVHELYTNNHNSLTNIKSSYLSLADYPADARQKMATYTEDFARAYLHEEAEKSSGALPLLIALPYLLSFALSIYLFKDIFENRQSNTSYVAPPVSHVNTSQSYRPVTAEQVSAILDNNINTIPPPIPVHIKINYATEEKIGELPGIGAVQAINIIKDRQLNGFFADFEDFKRRITLSERIYNNLKERLDFAKPDNSPNKGKGRVIEF